MASYIASNDNRYYTALETAYGAVPPITGANRFPGVSLAIAQHLEKPARRDKTGSRTFGGVPTGLRKRTEFAVKTYLMSWPDQTVEPSHGPLIQSCFGASPRAFLGGTVSSTPATNQIQFSVAHGLLVGQAVTFGGELRFASAVVDTRTIEVNVPFSVTPASGAALGKTYSYQPAKTPKSVSLFDYWSPSTAVQRIVSGGAVDKMRVKVNGDFHEFEFAGPACDLVDSSSFAAGMGSLTSFPAEPALGAYNFTPVPGHLGQAWLGAIPQQVLTLTHAEFVVQNNLDMRAKEFGALTPRAVVAGSRTVSLSFGLYGQDDTATKSLYQAAKQRSPIGVMFQLGQQTGQMFGVYLKSVVPEIPEFDDGETRMEWSFSPSQAQGTIDDEIFVAFG